MIFLFVPEFEAQVCYILDMGSWASHCTKCLVNNKRILKTDLVNTHKVLRTPWTHSKHYTDGVNIINFCTQILHNNPVSFLEFKKNQ